MFITRFTRSLSLIYVTVDLFYKFGLAQMCQNLNALHIFWKTTFYAMYWPLSVQFDWLMVTPLQPNHIGNKGKNWIYKGQESLVTKLIKLYTFLWLKMIKIYKSAF